MHLHSPAILHPKGRQPVQGSNGPRCSRRRPPAKCLDTDLGVPREGEDGVWAQGLGSAPLAQRGVCAQARGRPRPCVTPAAPELTCVDPQVHLQVVRRAEGLPAVRTVLRGRAQAPVPQQRGRLHAGRSPRLLAEVCSGGNVGTSLQRTSKVVRTQTANATQSQTCQYRTCLSPSLNLTEC